MIKKCVGILALAGLVISARAETWDELIAQYNSSRLSYAPLVLPLSGWTIDDIEAAVLDHSYSFVGAQGYYVDFDIGTISPEMLPNAALADGQWFYIIEDLINARVLVMGEQGQVYAEQEAESWPTSAVADSEFMQEINKRRMVLWWHVGDETETISVASEAASVTVLETESMMFMGTESNCPCLLDIDGDGVPNRAEVAAGTDTYDPESYFAFSDYVHSNDDAMVYSWYGVTNREYLLQSGGTNSYSNGYAFADISTWLPGANDSITYTDTTIGSNQFYAMSRLLVRERDTNTNGLPDWWEVQQYGALTNVSSSSDSDGDGLDNYEEYWYGYSPTNSERVIYHSVFHAVTVNDNDPAGEDDGTEMFDFHGGGRPLSLASNALGNGFGSLNGEGLFSGGIYFNNDLTNLYIGVSGVRLEGANTFIMFLDTDSGGVTNLRHISSATTPYGISRFANLNFNATNFTPNVALILGGRFADGHNYDNYDFVNGVTTNNTGQGVYRLSDGADYPGFDDTGPSMISQWARGYSGDNRSAQAGIEVAIPLADLNTSPSGTIRVAAMFVGGTDGSSNRYVSGEIYGKSVAGTLSVDNYGFSATTVIGSDVALSSPERGLQSCSYAGFTDDDAIFQAYYWDVVPLGGWYNVLATQYVDFATAGFSMVWLPPPSKAAGGENSVGYDPFDQYDLGEYNQKGNYRTKYGVKADLTNIIAKLRATNITPICDIVLNHMAGGTNSPTYKTYNYPHGRFNKSSSDFHPSSAGHNDELEPYHNNYGFGASDNHPVDNAFLAPNMRQGFKAWGNWLATNMLYSGWRLDFTEGVEPWYINEWLNAPDVRPYFAFMEYWENATGVQQEEWLDMTGWKAAIYDWYLRDNIFKPMCENNGSFDMNLLKAPSLLGRQPNYTVVFVENHDTFRPEFDGKVGITSNREMAYAYAFHSQGLPLVFYRDYYLAPYYNTNTYTYYGTPLKPKIDRLLAIRKATVAGGVQYLSTNSDVFVQQRDGGTTKPGSILIMNDNSSSTLSIQVGTMYSDTILKDWVETNSPNSVTTDVDGVVTLSCPPRGYRIYSVTNAMP